MIPTILTFHKEPRVTLVGAGPGDPELITLKGVNALKSADVVLFDALVSEQILRLVPEGIPMLSVGKRAGSHSCSQEEINQMIVELAYIHGHVVRLKGGDPFVFGRGSEEIEYAEAHGLQTAVIPGISSSIAVPGALNIPVTARGLSESFWVITGTTRDGEMSADINLAAQSTATVVILMGMKKLERIMDCFKEHSRFETPVAVIQNGTMANQKSVIGTVSTIVSLTKNEDLASPGIIVVGEVVRHARELSKVVDSTALNNYE
jgi:uroporphyrin-III C-methyltransferase